MRTSILKSTPVVFLLLCFCVTANSLAQDSSENENGGDADQAVATKAADKEESKEDSETDAEPASTESSEKSKTIEDKSSEDEAEEDEEEKEEDKTISIDGRFAAETQETITIRPKGWSGFSVVTAVEHGQEVKKGEVLIEFDSRSINESVADLEADIAAGELALIESEHKLELLKKTLPMRLEKIERAERIATENLKRFLTVKRDSRKRTAKRRVMNAENWLAYQQEELNQLEKMYEADDLTEETEEIILLRTRHDVESARYALQQTRESAEETLAIDLPRHEESLEESVRKATLTLEETKLKVPAELEEAERAFKTKQIKHERSVARLERLKHDQELMQITAPISGTVYYGRSHHGKWSDPKGLAAQLRPGGTVKPNQSVMTIVKMAPINISGWISEKDLPKLTEGTSGIVKPTAYPEATFEATIAKVSKIPAGDKFQATMEFSDAPDDVRIVPGMTCDVEFAVESEAAADADDE